MIPATREAESAPVAVRVSGRLFPFTSYADVSRAYTAAVDASGAVAGTTAWAWRLKDVPIAPDCEILDGRGDCIAWISYNGRVWCGPLHNNDYRLIYDPCGDLR